MAGCSPPSLEKTEPSLTEKNLLRKSLRLTPNKNLPRGKAVSIPMPAIGLEPREAEVPVVSQSPGSTGATEG